MAQNGRRHDPHANPLLGRGKSTGWRGGSRARPEQVHHHPPAPHASTSRTSTVYTRPRGAHRFACRSSTCASRWSGSGARRTRRGRRAGWWAAALARLALTADPGRRGRGGRRRPGGGQRRRRAVHRARARRERPQGRRRGAGPRHRRAREPARRGLPRARVRELLHGAGARPRAPPRADEVLTGAEVRRVRGAAGRFEIELALRPRGVDPAACLGCGECAKVCPAERVDPFRRGSPGRGPSGCPIPAACRMLRHRPGACLRARGDACVACLAACAFGAIRLDEAPSTRTVTVGAIVVATGLTPGEVEGPDGVVSSYRLERMLHPNGPTGGAIRGAGGREPRAVLLRGRGGRRRRRRSLEILKLAHLVRGRLSAAHVAVTGDLDQVPQLRRPPRSSRRRGSSSSRAGSGRRRRRGREAPRGPDRRRRRRLRARGRPRRRPRSRARCRGDRGARRAAAASRTG